MVEQLWDEVATGSPEWWGSRVVELRRYRLHPGARDNLIELFDREFVESQEAVGMRVLGQFRDLDDPDSFVWMRGFPDMPSRAAALSAFYGGPIWAQHRSAANATMIDSDNVLLLRPVLTGEGAPDIMGSRATPGEGGDGPGLVVAMIFYLDPQYRPDDFARQFEEELGRQIASTGSDIIGTFVTEESPNTFSRLPVREGEKVWMALIRVSDAAAGDQLRSALQAGSPSSSARSRLCREPEVLRLKPTARSLLHG